MLTTLDKAISAFVVSLIALLGFFGVAIPEWIPAEGPMLDTLAAFIVSLLISAGVYHTPNKDSE